VTHFPKYIRTKKVEIEQEVVSLPKQFIKLITMKKLFVFALFSISMFGNAQVFKGKKDVKAQVGFSFQKGGASLIITNDYGIGENISIGIVGSFLLNADQIEIAKPKVEDKLDLKVRFNANIGNVINLDKKFDLYPGLSLGLKNLGGHVGARYFFTNGFGVFTEVGFPIARYNNEVSGYKLYNNQFVLSAGASFNL
jgi:hypothetical protein